MPSTASPAYRARAFGRSARLRSRIGRGGTIEGIRYGSIDANLERRTGRNCWIQLSLTEGKNREVRGVEHLGFQVSRLIRTVRTVHVAGLAPGRVAEVDRNQPPHFRNSLK